MRDNAKATAKTGKHPAHERRADVQANVAANANTLEAIAREWLTKKKADTSQYYQDQIAKVLEADVFPPAHILAAAEDTPKRKPQRNRMIAKKAADAIRSFRFACIYEAADAYFPELAGGKGEKERRKNFVKYVYEYLEKV